MPVLMMRVDANDMPESGLANGQSSLAVSRWAEDARVVMRGTLGPISDREIAVETRAPWPI